MSSHPGDVGEVHCLPDVVQVILEPFTVQVLSRCAPAKDAGWNRREGGRCRRSCAILHKLDTVSLFILQYVLISSTSTTGFL